MRLRLTTSQATWPERINGSAVTAHVWGDKVLVNAAGHSQGVLEIHTPGGRVGLIKPSFQS